MSIIINWLLSLYFLLPPSKTNSPWRPMLQCFTGKPPKSPCHPHRLILFSSLISLSLSFPRVSHSLTDFVTTASPPPQPPPPLLPPSLTWLFSFFFFQPANLEMNESSRWTEEEMETAKKGNKHLTFLLPVKCNLIAVPVHYNKGAKGQSTRSSSSFFFFFFLA